MRISLLKIQLLNEISQLGSSEGKDTVDYKTWFPSQCNLEMKLQTTLISFFSDGFQILGCACQAYSSPHIHPFSCLHLYGLSRPGFACFCWLWTPWFIQFYLSQPSPLLQLWVQQQGPHRVHFKVKFSQNWERQQNAIDRLSAREGCLVNIVMLCFIVIVRIPCKWNMRG